MVRPRSASEKGRGEEGAAMVEFAIVFPVQLLVFLLGLQLCLIVVGKHVVNYAAFCATRAELVDDDDPETAAAAALVPIGGVSTDGGSYDALPLPGWSGSSPDLDVLSRRAREKLKVEIVETYTNEFHHTANGRIVTKVRFAFEMMIPMANWVIYYGLEAMNPGLVHFNSIEDSGIPDNAIGVVIGGTPHLILEEEGLMPAYNEVRINAETPHEVKEDPDHPRMPDG